MRQRGEANVWPTRSWRHGSGPGLEWTLSAARNTHTDQTTRQLGRGGGGGGGGSEQPQPNVPRAEKSLQAPGKSGGDFTTRRRRRRSWGGGGNNNPYLAPPPPPPATRVVNLLAWAAREEIWLLLRPRHSTGRGWLSGCSLPRPSAPSPHPAVGPVPRSERQRSRTDPTRPVVQGALRQRLELEALHEVY